MNLPAFGVRKPVTNLMIFISVLILAFYSLTKIGVDFFPEIAPPSITVIVSYPGANPEDVEIKVTEVLENQLSTTPGIERITSVSAGEVSIVTLKFAWGVNLDEASNDIRDRIELSKRFLPDIPDEIENPFMFKFNTANIPIIFLGITARESYPVLHDLIDRRVGDKLRQLPGVGAVQFQGGGLERQINVWIDPQRLKAYGLSVLDIQGALKRENITQPVGSLKSGMSDYLIRLPGEFAAPEELNSVILGMRQGTLIYLKDVARVEDGFKEMLTRVRVNRQQALIMMVQKQSGANTVEVARRINADLRELKKTLPSDVDIVTIFDTSQDITASLRSLHSSVWLSIILVIAVVWFFLRHFAASAVIALSIPFSLLISFIYLFLSGRTINVISLSSIAIASGMVVDSAIVVVDNIFRRMERGERPGEAAIFGTSEMFLAISASVLTTVVVFLPLLFVRGVIGIIFGELAAIVIVTLFASLFTASTFTPMLCSRWLRLAPARRGGKTIVGRMYDASESFFRRMEYRYGRGLSWCLHHKKLLIISCALIFSASLLLIPFVGTEFIPEEDTGDARMTIHLPIGTRVEETDAVASRIEDILKNRVPEARYYFIRSGQIPGIGRAFGNVSGTHIITAGVKLVSKNERARGVKEIGQDIRGAIRAVPGVMRVDIATGNPIGRLIAGGQGKAVQVEVLGHSFEDTDAVSARVRQLMAQIPGAVDVSISREERRQELQIAVDRIKAAALGFDMETIAGTLKAYIQGSLAGRYREAGETYDIVVRLDERYRSRIEDIANLPLISGPKNTVLSNAATITEERVPQEIERKNRQRVVRVECNAYRRSSGKIVDELRSRCASLTLPRGVSINFGGEAEEQAKSFRDLLLLLALGICLVYMVMAAQFESLLDPCIIMFSIPFMFTGIIPALFLTGTTLSVTSFLGVVMLTGIVVDNAIVLISYIQILRARGMPLAEAISAGGQHRLRAVLMTTVTTMAGILPLAFSKGQGAESWQPLGITMLGGLTVSSIITMFLVPTIYAVFETRIKKGAQEDRGKGIITNSTQ